ncbi:MAG: hypothetical protein IPF66_07165 [Holophagales bacterium]|nr:hypothetical protein [Holophagales bacterium]
MRGREARERVDARRMGGLAGPGEEEALAEGHEALRAAGAGDGTGRNRAGAADGIGV